MSLGDELRIISGPKPKKETKEEGWRREAEVIIAALPSRLRAVAVAKKFKVEIAASVDEDSRECFVGWLCESKYVAEWAVAQGLCVDSRSESCGPGGYMWYMVLSW